MRGEEVAWDPFAFMARPTDAEESADEPSAVQDGPSDYELALQAQ